MTFWTFYKARKFAKNSKKKSMKIVSFRHQNESMIWWGYLKKLEGMLQEMENDRKNRKRKKTLKRAFVSGAKNRLDVNQLTFWRWEYERRSPYGDFSGSSKASRASVRSSSSRTSSDSSPRSANCSDANFKASSTLLSRISSMSCCCCN